MEIVQGDQEMEVGEPVFVIVGVPGVGKTTLGNGASDAHFTADADNGAHRSKARQTVGRIKSWADAEELAESKVLDGKKTVSVDTAGRFLDMLADAIMIEDTKNRTSSGTLTPTGWGVLRLRFSKWVARLRERGITPIFICHAKEDKDGDETRYKADMQGGSYGELMKIADFVGFIRMVGNERVLDFNPTDHWVGKNMAQWKPFTVPDFKKQPLFLSTVIEAGRVAIGKGDEAQAKAVSAVDEWRTQVMAAQTTSELNALIEKGKELPKKLAAQAKKILGDRARTLGFKLDAKTKSFVPAK